MLRTMNTTNTQSPASSSGDHFPGAFGTGTTCHWMVNTWSLNFQHQPPVTMCVYMYTWFLKMHQSTQCWVMLSVNCDGCLFFPLSSCRWGIQVAFFLVLYLGQYLVVKLLYYPYVSNPLTNFIDLMYLANISTIVLDDKHSGYYLHGRNHSQHSDTTLRCA